MISLIAFLLIGAALVASLLLNGWAVSLLWGWFAVPAFGLPALTVAQAIGVALLIGYSTAQFVEKPGDPASAKDRLVHAMSWMLARPLVAVAFGWAIKAYA